jgi:hypothetical protein
MGRLDQLVRVRMRNSMSSVKSLPQSYAQSKRFDLMNPTTTKNANKCVFLFISFVSISLNVRDLVLYQGLQERAELQKNEFSASASIIEKSHRIRFVVTHNTTNIIFPHPSISMTEFSFKFTQQTVNLSSIFVHKPAFGIIVRFFIYLFIFIQIESVRILLRHNASLSKPNEKSHAWRPRLEFLPLLLFTIHLDNSRPHAFGLSFVDFEPIIYCAARKI